MAGKSLRTVKPAHKSDRVTVAEVEKAWRKVANESASGGPSPAAVRGSATSHASSISSKGGTGSGKEKPTEKDAAIEQYRLAIHAISQTQFDPGVAKNYVRSGSLP